MRKSVSVFLLFLICIFLTVTAAASAMDVKITEIKRTTYGYLQGYGFYGKCANYSEFWMILTNNSGNKAYTISFPETGKIGTTTHPLTNMQYRKLDFNSEDYNNPFNPKTPFTGEFTLPAQSTYAVFLDVKNFEPYNLYWDTDLFFTIQVKDGSTKAGDINVAGKLIRRGDACGDDRNCFAEVLSGAYNAAGGGDVTIFVRNNMPDWTYVTGKSDVTISWKDSGGQNQSRTVENAVKWGSNPGSLGSGDAATVTGTLTLPAEITAANKTLNLKFHFTRPSSTPGYTGFYAQQTFNTVSGLQVVFTGNYDTDGVKGTFTAAFHNNQEFPITLKVPSAAKAAAEITLPTEGIVKDASGKSNQVKMRWANTQDVVIPAGKSETLNGELSFVQTDLVQNNTTLILTANMAGAEAAAGTITRNADPNPLITASSFCRNYQAGSKKMTFRYSLENRSNISIRTELATTMAIPGQLPNPKIRYTDCVSSNGSSCMNRIDGKTSIITLSANESAVFSGEVDLYTTANADVWAQTSLRYFPDNKTIALFVGRTTTTCTGSVKPTPAPTTFPVGNDLETVSTCRKLENNKVAFQYTLKNKTAKPIILDLARTLAVQGQDGVVDIKYNGFEKEGATGSISAGDYKFTLNAGDTVKFNCEAALTKVPSAKDFTVRTSLVYQADGKEKAYFIGRWNNDCSGSAPVPSSDQQIIGSAFCRTLSADGKKVSVSYTLENTSQNSVNVQLAQTLSLLDQPRYLPITYNTCTSSSINTTDCKARISVYDIQMTPHESITVKGEATLDKPISVKDFAAYTSLVYKVNDTRKVLNLGNTYDTCPSGTTSKDAETLMNDNFLAESILEGYVSSSYISSCGNNNTLHFNLKISNSGTANGIIDLSAISVNAGETQFPVKASSCAEMSASGTNNVTCRTELTDGFLTINPNVTMSLDLVAEGMPGSSPLSLQLLVPDVSGKALEFTARSDNSVCGPAVEVDTDSNDDAVSCTVSAAKNAVALKMLLTNYGNADAAVTPGSIYFTRDAIDNYSGEAVVVSREYPGNEKRFTFKKGERVMIPANSYALFNVGMSVNLSEAFSSTAKLTWHFDLDGKSANYTGTLNFSQKSVAISDIVDVADIVEKSFVPARPGGKNTLHFYSLDEPRIPEVLPATGISGYGLLVGLSQPADLKYQDLGGLHLEIPVIDAEMDLVKVPLDKNNEWAVEWLGDRAGVLSEGALPGRGTSLIAAHNHLDAMNAGPFKMLQYLGMKDRIFVTDAKGKLLSFSVYENELLEPNDGELLYQKAIPGSLVLVTCENELPEGGYAFRRVVYAEPLQ